MIPVTPKKQEERDMKKTISLFLTLSLVLCMLLALPLHAGAAVTEIQDGLEVTILTDQGKYDANEDIQVTLKIKNDNSFKVEGISAEILLPEGLELSDGDLTEDAISIEAGETKEITLTARAANAGELDPIILIIAIIAGVVLIAVIVILIVVIKRKKAKKAATAALCLLLTLSMLPFGTLATEEKKEQSSIGVFKTITAGSKKYTIKASVKYLVVEPNKPSANNGVVPPDVAELFGVDPNDYDTDKDGLSNYVEIYQTATDPKKEDSDDNGVKDGDEDTDGDGILNRREIQLGTDPSIVDTDGDDLDDKSEIDDYKTLPFNPDTDGDGLSDGDEIALGLDPLVQKSDGLMLDSQRKFTQTLDAGNISDALVAEDNDAIPSLTLTTTKAINNHVSIVTADTDAFGDSRAVVGSPIELSGENLGEGTISFTLKSASTGYTSESGSYNTKLICKYEGGSTAYLETTFDPDSNAVSAAVDGEGTYFVMDIKNLFDELGLALPTFSDINALKDHEAVKEYSLGSTSSTRAPQGAMAQADIVFLIDTTGSMSDEINNVKNNVQYFVDALKEKGVSAGFALIDYQDINADGYDSTQVHKNGTSNWFYNMDDYKSAISNLSLGNGGDYAECAVDALETGRLLDMRPSAGKIFILVTDASYKVANRYDIPSMEAEIELLKNAGITCAVVSPSSEKSTYSDLFTQTNGVWANIYGDFYGELMALADKIGTDIVGDGYWVYLDGPVPMPVRLDEEPTLGSTVDTDGDGIYDIHELEGITPTGKIDLDYLLTLASGGIITGTNYGFVAMYKYKTNPALADSDGDGILDFKDAEPNKWNISDRDLAMFAQICYQDIPAGLELSNLPAVYANPINEKFESAASLKELKGWRVLATHYSIGGLQIAVYENDGQMVFACRGSQPIDHVNAEWWDDWVATNALGFLTGINTQAPAAKAFLKKIMNRYSAYDVYITGHSLGGNVAYNVASKALSIDKARVKKINAYNGLGLFNGWDMWDGLRLIQVSSIITDYTIDGDVVYFIPATHYGGLPIILPNVEKTGDTHSLYSFFEHLPRYSESTDGGGMGGR